MQEAYAKYCKDFRSIRLEKANGKGKQFVQIAYTPCKPIFEDVATSTLTYILVLATYLSYSGKLEKRLRVPLTRIEIRKILKMQDSQFSPLHSQILDSGYLIRNEDGEYTTKPGVFVKGELPQKGHQYFFKMYSIPTRSLYTDRNASPDESFPLKQMSSTAIGIVIKLIPYIHRRYNFFCIDPFEEDLSDSVPMTAGDVCVALGRARSRTGDIEHYIKDMIFKIDGHWEYALCKVPIPDAKSMQRCYRIFVNPHLIRAGTNLMEIQSFADFRYPKPIDSIENNSITN